MIDESETNDWAGRTMPSETKGLALSVVMPVYKTPEAFLTPAIASVLSEAGVSLELILVDDSPGAESSALLEAAVRADRRVRLIKNARNRGPSHSRNEGLEAARGEYVAFHDADDLATEGAYKVLVECARGNDLDAVRGRVFRGRPADGIQGSGRLCLAVRGDEAWGRSVETIVRGFDWSPVGRVIKRAFAASIPFDRRTQHAEDLLHNLHIVGNGHRLGLLDQVVYLPQAYAESLSRRAPDVACYMDLAYVGGEIAKFVAQYASFPDGARRYYIGAALQAMFADWRVRQVVRGGRRKDYLARQREALNALRALRPSPFHAWTRLLLSYLAWRPQALFAPVPVAYGTLKVLIKFSVAMKGGRRGT